MCEKKITLPELIMAAVCYLQEKNGVSGCEIAQFVAKKRGCKVEQVEDMINMILCKAKFSDILCEHKGLYRINERYDDLPKFDEKPKKCGANVDIGSDTDCESDSGPDPCACLKLSKDCLNDQSDDDRCPNQKKRKCN